MSRLLIVVEKTADWGSFYPSENVISAIEYLKRPIADGEDRTQVINLCRSYRHLGVGYYVSLLAEARGHKVIPSVRTINDLRRRSLYGLDIEDLNQKMARFIAQEGRDLSEFAVLVYFGETSSVALQDLARQVFEAFPAPILKIEFERQRVWQIASVKPAGLRQLSDVQEDSFAAALDRFSRKLWRSKRRPKKFRYDVALLHDPNEEWPPSNKKAIKLFIAAGKELGIEVDPITKNDFARLAEYDALFIRETTALDHHTYRFANRAEKEDMVVIDDPTSILRCTNKIYLADLLKAKKLPIPQTEMLFRDDNKVLENVAEMFGFPMVLKVPDGSFSRGVERVADLAQLRAVSERLFQQSALLLAQEYLPTEFDWRIGVFDGEPLFACQYFMSRGHWQIYNHGARGDARSGAFKTLPVRDAPADVVKLAVRASQTIGNGLYGVDIKQLPTRSVIIEVNDNPNIDAGIEDAYLGADLYRKILDVFLRRLERKRLGVTD